MGRPPLRRKQGGFLQARDLRTGMVRGSWEGLRDGFGGAFGRGFGRGLWRGRRIVGPSIARTGHTVPASRHGKAPLRLHDGIRQGRQADRVTALR